MKCILDGWAFLLLRRQRLPSVPRKYHLHYALPSSNLEEPAVCQVMSVSMLRQRNNSHRVVEMQCSNVALKDTEINLNHLKF